MAALFVPWQISTLPVVSAIGADTNLDPGGHGLHYFLKEFNILINQTTE